MASQGGRRPRAAAAAKRPAPSERGLPHDRPQVGAPVVVLPLPRGGGHDGHQRGGQDEEEGGSDAGDKRTTARVKNEERLIEQNSNYFLSGIKTRIEDKIAITAAILDQMSIVCLPVQTTSLL